ncbi:MAG: NAD(P)-dependent oxidoreductase [Halobacteriovoraceae bacterium]|nr:NAD(P)-dependent oxidoreductase [Halobacteriovoraceae bacterium]
MKVFISGITGFIGKRLAEHLANQGQQKYQIVGCGRGPHPEFSPPIYYKQIKDWRSEDLYLAIEGCDVVVHCAGKAGSWGDYQDFFHANVELTERILEISKRAGVKRFINLSSPSMYFQLKDQKGLKEEDVPQKFFDAYGETKFLSERKVQSYHSESFFTLSLRPRGVIGAGDNNWFPRIIDLYKAGKLIRPGEGENLADFTSVKNLITYIEYLFECPPEIYGEVYNISNGEPVKLWNFITQGLGLIENKQIEVKSLPLGLLMGVAYFSQFLARLFHKREEPKLLPLKIGVASYSMTLNIEKARGKGGYTPQQSTNEAMEEFARWWSSR